MVWARAGNDWGADSVLGTPWASPESVMGVRDSPQILTADKGSAASNRPHRRPPTFAASETRLAAQQGSSGNCPRPLHTLAVCRPLALAWVRKCKPGLRSEREADLFRNGAWQRLRVMHDTEILIDDSSADQTRREALDRKNWSVREIFLSDMPARSRAAPRPVDGQGCKTGQCPGGANRGSEKRGADRSVQHIHSTGRRKMGVESRRTPLG
ncbi:hypothetical protein ANO11243_077630 [Dothideomycetidae sp. 11243]|nr:hypothetical protein ANO11243_077630 [fungal sp. No.11243]